MRIRTLFSISLHAEVAGRVLLLFTTFREQFVRIDATELRAKYFGNEVPPPRPDPAAPT